MSLVDKWRRLTSWGCLALFGASLTQVAYYTEHDGEGMTAALALLTGWPGILEGSPACWAWLGNVFLAGALVSNVLAPRLTFIPGMLTLFFMVSFLGARRIFVDEAGHEAAITRLGAGYWLWLASAAVLVVSNALSLFSREQAAAGD